MLSVIFEPHTLIRTFGLIGVLVVLFIESGTFAGFVLPGDSLLFTAGLLASQGFLNLPLLLILGTFAAVLGDSVGYWFGRKVGPKLFTREDSFLFRKSHLKKAELFYTKYGKKAIVIGRFLAIIRMFAPILAGVGNMEYKVFLRYNVIGAFLWVVSLSALGYFLGSVIPNIDQYLLPIIGFIIVLSLIPAIFHLLKAKFSKKTIN